MKEVIERMLKVEEDARAIVAEAEKRAGEILEASRRRASEGGEKLRGEAHAEATRRLEESRRLLDKERQERLARSDQANAEYARKVRTSFTGAVDLVVRRVIGG